MKLFTFLNNQEFCVWTAGLRFYFYIFCKRVQKFDPEIYVDDSTSEEDSESEIRIDGYIPPIIVKSEIWSKIKNAVDVDQPNFDWENSIN